MLYERTVILGVGKLRFNVELLKTPNCRKNLMHPVMGQLWVGQVVTQPSWPRLRGLEARATKGKPPVTDLLPRLTTPCVLIARYTPSSPFLILTSNFSLLPCVCPPACPEHSRRAQWIPYNIQPRYLCRGYTLNAPFGRLYIARRLKAGCHRKECLTFSPPPGGMKNGL